MTTWKQLITTCFCLLFLSSCVKNNQDKADPYEKFNRRIFKINSDVDHLVMRPAANVYNAITPKPIKIGLHNFFTNLDSLITLPNDLLQLKFKYLLNDGMRFIVNSTIGLAGLFDVASAMHMPKHHEDFGLTLAYYSHNHQSPYLILPLLGPSTFRDALGQITDETCLNSTIHIIKQPTRSRLIALNIINIRHQLMPLNDTLDEAIDPYVFLRNAYLQRRQARVQINQLESDPSKPITIDTADPANTNAIPLVDDEYFFDDEDDDEDAAISSPDPKSATPATNTPIPPNQQKK